MTDSLNPITPTICTWMGRDILDLTREELIQIVKQLGEDLQTERNRHQSTLEIWKLCRKKEA